MMNKDVIANRLGAAKTSKVDVSAVGPLSLLHLKQEIDDASLLSNLPMWLFTLEFMFDNVGQIFYKVVRASTAEEAIDKLDSFFMDYYGRRHYMVKEEGGYVYDIDVRIKIHTYEQIASYQCIIDKLLIS